MLGGCGIGSRDRGGLIGLAGPDERVGSDDENDSNKRVS
jgi:hypothetical protein